MIRNLTRAYIFFQEGKHVGALSEEASECAEEPEQRLCRDVKTNVYRHEQIRLWIIGSGLLCILLSFLLFLFTKIFLPLFGTIVIAYLLYDYVDNHLRRTET
jgi:hypothetical protein